MVGNTELASATLEYVKLFVTSSFNTLAAHIHTQTCTHAGKKTLNASQRSFVTSSFNTLAAHIHTQTCRHAGKTTLNASQRSFVFWFTIIFATVYASMTSWMPCSFALFSWKQYSILNSSQDLGYTKMLLLFWFCCCQMQVIWSWGVAVDTLWAKAHPGNKWR